ncbi:hypothetical protein ACLKA7_009475 [Drosophila subpalustris]
MVWRRDNNNNNNNSNLDQEQILDATGRLPHATCHNQVPSSFGRRSTANTLCDYNKQPQPKPQSKFVWHAANVARTSQSAAATPPTPQQCLPSYN